MKAFFFFILVLLFAKIWYYKIANYKYQKGNYVEKPFLGLFFQNFFAVFHPIAVAF
jgi:hypothetical protein